MNAPKLASRPGVSLVETLVAITLMAVVLSGLGGMAFTASRQTMTLSANSMRQGVLVEEVNRMSNWPFDQLAGQAGCRTLGTGTQFPHQRCITIMAGSPATPNNARVRIVITPTQPGVRPDSVTLERTRAPVANVLSAF